MNKLTSKSASALLLDLIPWVGLIAALATAIVNKVLGPDWAVAFAAASLAAMWIALIQYLAAAKKYHQSADIVLKNIVNPPNEAEAPLLLSMRFGFLAERGIDDEFWALYCSRLLDKVRADRMDPPAILRVAKELQDGLEKRQVIADLDYAYSLMVQLFSIVTLTGGNTYKGIFTKADIDPTTDRTIKDKIDDLVFDLPLRPQARVMRLFLLHSSELRGLPKELRKKLSQQLKSPTVELRRLDPIEQVPNIGIYGESAFGELHAARGVNIFNFDRNAVRKRLSEFNELWQRAQPLTATDLTSPDDLLEGMHPKPQVTEHEVRPTGL